MFETGVLQTVRRGESRREDPADVADVSRCGKRNAKCVLDTAQCMSIADVVQSNVTRSACKSKFIHYFP